ncbi:MAG: 4'-phosphopantetheinyl transferase superfamily protein [Bacteroidetes bacterium]|nr:4'-phosphopantetheinyl transferase superfamily protein [Bacteroidota bacterium]MBS1930739.1 4'-phosphopantetheinyl transferase superfamily protein [Bacteroidota bacterium]
MPVFFQHIINDTTRLGIWKIEESEDFFKGNVPQHRDVTHPHKRLQHLAGRFLLQFLFPDFPYELIKIADTKKPFLPNEQYHFSISHCGDYAAAIVSKDKRVGIDVEIPVEKIKKIQHKFVSAYEQRIFNLQSGNSVDRRLTLLWSVKEAVYKWFGDGEVEFIEHIRLQNINEGEETMHCFFAKTSEELTIHYRNFDRLVLTWVCS